MRKWILRLVLLAALVVVGYVVKDTLLAPKPVAVELDRVARGPVEWTITNSKAGTIKARRRAKLSPGISGVVTELGVTRGERVEQGATLLRLDDATQMAERFLAERTLEVAEANHAKAKVAVDRALRELDRNRQLAEKKVVSLDVLDALESVHALALADRATAAAEVERSRAALAVAQAWLDKTVLRAPFDAVLAEVSVELGEWVTPSVPLLRAPDLIDAIDTSSLYVSAPMDEVDVNLLRPGQSARVTIDPFPDQSFPGRIARVAPYVLDLEAQNRTLEVEVELDDAAFSATLLPGTSADIEVVLEVREDVLRIPTHALLEGGRVLVVAGDRLVERAVEVGLRNWDWVEVQSGLEPDERVVTNLDREGVKAGALVEPDGGGGRAVIRLEDIWRTYRVGGLELHALAGVDETIAAGEHVAIMGPSGSGKSTLLNLMGCLDRPTRGSYLLGGREVAQLDERELAQVRREQIGYVFQSYHLVPRLDAAGNIELPLIFAGLPRSERRRRAAEALAAVGLSDRAKHRPSELSGGQCQRVAIARAMIQRPAVLLADEPTGNLDRSAGRQILDLLEGLNGEGLTLIVVTHDLEVARRAERVILLEDGKVVQRLPGKALTTLTELLGEEAAPP